MTQTINLANIRIGMDIDKLKEGGIKARQELSALTRALKAGADPFEELAKKKELLDRALATGGINQGAYDQMLAGFRKSTGVDAAEEKLRREKADRERQDQSDIEKRRAERVRRIKAENAAQQAALAEMDKEVAKRNKQDEALRREATKHEEMRLARVKQLTEQVATAQERHNARMREYQKLSSQLSGDTLKRLESQSLAKMHGELTGGSKQGVMDDFLQTITVRAIAYSVAYKAIAASKEAVVGSVKAFADFQNSMVQLTILTGSKSVAKQLYEDFRLLDRQSPLSTAQFQRAAVTLLGYGTSVKSITPALRALSEISMGNEERFQNLALAYAQVQANGRLMGQEVIQMVNAGFNPLQQISKDTGKSMFQLKRDMEDGAISAYMVAEAFKNATKEGGRFHNMNEYLSRTLSGRYAKLQSEIVKKQQEAGGMFSGLTGKVLENAATALGNYQPDVALAGTLAMEAGRGGLYGQFLQTLLAFNQDTMAGYKERAELEDRFNRLLEAEADKQLQIVKSLQEQKNELHDRVTLMTMGQAELDRQKSVMTGVAIAEFEILTNLKNQVAYLERKKQLERDMLEVVDAKKEIEKQIYEERLKAGMSEDNARELQLLEEQLRVQKEIIARRKDDAAAAEREVLQRQREAFALFQDAQKPQDKFMDELQKFRDLFKDGFIDEDTMNKAGLRTAMEMKQALIPGGIAPSLKAGTAEAYRFVQQQNEQRRIAAEAKKLAEKSNRHLEAIENAVKDGVVLRKKR